MKNGVYSLILRIVFASFGFGFALTLAVWLSWIFGCDFGRSEYTLSELFELRPLLCLFIYCSCGGLLICVLVIVACCGDELLHTIGRAIGRMSGERTIGTTINEKKYGKKTAYPAKNGDKATRMSRDE